MPHGRTYPIDRTETTAEALGTWGYDTNAIDYKVHGLHVTTQRKGSKITVSPGRAIIGSQGRRIRVDLTEAVDREAVYDGKNYVSLEFDLDSKSSVAIELHPARDDVPDRGLLLGVVDTQDEEVEDTNVHPDASFGTTTHDIIETTGIDIGPDTDVTTVRPSDDWHEKVGDENDPIGSGVIVVLPGAHETRRRTLLAPGSETSFIGVGDATLTKSGMADEPLITDATQGDETIEVADPSDLRVRRGIMIYAPAQTSTTGRRTHHTHITAIDGNTVTLNRKISTVDNNDFLVENDAACSQTHSFITTELSDESYAGIHIRGLNFDGGGRRANAQADFSIAAVYSFGDTGGSIRDCRIYDHHAEGISSQYGHAVSIESNWITNVNYHGIHIGLASTGTEIRQNWVADGQGTALYISDDTTGLTITGNHLIDFEADPPDGVARVFTANAGGIGDFDHDNDGSIVENNTIELRNVAAHGIETDAMKHGQFTGNRIFVNSAAGISIGDCEDLKISENHMAVLEDSTEGYCIRSDRGSSTMKIRGNTLRAPQPAGAPIAIGGQGHLIEGNTLATSSTAAITAEADAELAEMVVTGNTVESGAGLFRADGEVTDTTFSENVGQTAIEIAADTRVLIEGWSTNDGDPSTTGAWLDSGRAGVAV